MATEKQREAARKNIRKAQTAWKAMSHQQRAQAQPEGNQRKQPGAAGTGEYYHIGVRPKEEFVLFRTQDVGEPGHIQRVGGMRQSGSWATVKWLISKQDAHMTDGKLVPDTEDARELLAKLGSEPTHVEGDVFEAKPRRAHRENIKNPARA